MALSDLVIAMNIFLKYGNPAYPTNCEHDELIVFISPSLVSEKDKGLLDGLGFFESEDDCFKSFKYGSA